MITSKQRAELRSRANELDTTLMIGKEGITDALLSEADRQLEARELIKGKVLETAFLSAREASDELAGMGYRLKIYDAYRPQMAVDRFVEWARDAGDARMKAYFYPELEKAALFPQGYIAKHSGHSRGSTVDLTLFDMASGKDVDMGGTFDYFGERSHADYRGVTDAQYANRMLLRDVMTAHGFKPISKEWWHFTLRDEPYPDTYFTFPVNSESAAPAADGDATELPFAE